MMRRALVVALLALAWLPAAAAAQSGPAYVFWNNPQSGTIGRATVDGAGVNQNFITGLSSGQPLPGVGVDRTHIFWADGLNVGRAALDGTGVNRRFIATEQGAAVVAVDADHVFWASGFWIGRANLDGTGADSRFLELPSGQSSVSAMAVDNDHVYWADSERNTIGRANLDGTGVEPAFIRVAQGDFPGVQGIATDGRHLFWSESLVQGIFGNIARANVDGTGVDHSFITGVYQAYGVAVDFEHLYWVNDQFGCTPPACQGGTIGRANLDGTGVQQDFITADPRTGPGCANGDGMRCGPDFVAASLPPGPNCLRLETPPAAPSKGAVFSRPLEPGGDANVVVIPAGGTWTGAASCDGIAAGADDVMSHPTSVSVAPGAAVLLQDGPAGLSSAWGGRNVAAGDPAPVLFPGRSDFQTTSAQVMPPAQLLQSHDGCQGCVLPDDLRISPGTVNPDVAYQRDLSGATANGATLTGSFTGWDFTDVVLGGATLDGTDVSGADFTGADLRGAQLTSLVQSRPATFANVRVGALGTTCTTFTDIDLTRSGLVPVQADLLVPGCATHPLLPRSTVPLALVDLIAHRYAAPVDFSSAQLLVTAADSGVLAGVDLHGIRMAEARLLGFPANLQGTVFDGGLVSGAGFGLADLSTASFAGATAVGTSFQDANLEGAKFPTDKTSLRNADFVGADVSGATFQSADISGAVFDRVLAVGTDFNSVVATNASFNGAHIYGDGANGSSAFDGARQLTNADFVGAVLAGSEDGSGGFDFTNALMSGAKFDNAQCVACNFTGSTLTGASFPGAYLPGAQLASATIASANFDSAWLYCGDTSDSGCKAGAGAKAQWPLALGAQENYGPVPFYPTTLTDGEWANVTTCPDGGPPDPTDACKGRYFPGGTLPGGPGDPHTACTAVALDACPTLTSTLFDATALTDGAPISVVAATPPTWASNVTTRGFYVGLRDGTIRRAGAGGSAQVFAGAAGSHCPSPTQACGDGGPGGDALLGTPAGLAVGLDGSLYIADPDLLRVRRIDPSGTITTVAGSGQACASATDTCGDGGAATAAALGGPSGVWASPSGELFIADGERGIRQVAADGTITTIATDEPRDIVSVAGDATGVLYAAAHDPDYLLQVDLASGKSSIVAGTGTSGYNGNQGAFGLAPGTEVQLNQPNSLSVALDGDVVFADTGNHLIRAYVPSTGYIIDDLAGEVTDGNPQSGFNDDGHLANDTELDAPGAVTVTRGALYVIADTGNARLRQVGPGQPPPELGGFEPPPISPPARPRPPAAPSPAVGGPSAPARPDNRFTVRRVKVRRNGTITFSVRVRAAGKLDVRATMRRTRRLRPGSGRFVFARAERRARRAGTLRVRVRPTARARRFIRRGVRLPTLRLAVTFTPSGGRPRQVERHALRLPQPER
ncbi:MAG: pentapeptide repeat-containing protein [Solirubrobacteraceae bacterium]